MATLLQSKLYIPPLRPKLVARARLTEQFLTGLRLGRRLTVISAPAGFGKTTLLTACLQQAADTHDACWVSLDDNDNDFSRFFIYLIAAIQTIQPAFGQALLSTLSSLPLPEPQPITNALLNELDTVDQAIILVLDDYHVITDPSIHQAVETIIEYLPPTIHLALTSRSEPPLPLPRWQVRNQLTRIRADALRFQNEEAHLFLQETMGMTLGETAVTTLTQRTEGWIAGLQLAVLSLQGHENPANHIDSFTGSDRLVTDYLLSEVLNRQSPQTQRFLLHTSILDRFNAALCDHLLDQANSQHLLETLEQINLFLTPLDNRRRWYRYHHLFADLLRDRLQREQPHGAVADLHLRAADWFLQNNQRADAIQHALQANAPDRAAAILAAAPASMLWGENSAGLIRQWAQRLPDSALLRHPRSLFLIGSAHILVGDIPMVHRYLTLGQTPQAANSLDDLVRAELAVLRSILARNDGDHGQAVALLEEARPFFNSIDPTVQNVARLQLAINYYETGHLDKAEASCTALQSKLAQEEHPDLTMQLQTMRIEAYLARSRADLTAAEQICRAGIRLAAETAVSSPMVGVLINGLGDLHFEWNELDKAAACYERTVELGKRTGITDIATEANLGQASLALLAGDFDTVTAILNDLMAQIRPTNLSGLTETGTAMHATYQLRMGNLATAVRWANASGYRLQDRPGYTQFHPYRLLAEIRLREELPAPNSETLRQILTLLDHLLTVASTAGYRHGVMLCHLLQAMTRQASDRPTDAFDALHAALDIAQPGGYIHTITMHGAPIQTLLRQIEYHDPNYVGRLLAAFPDTVAPHDETTATGSHSDLLTDREQDVLNQLASGRTNKEIENALFISNNTVRTHLKNLYSKLGVDNRTQAVIRARELGLLS